MSNTIVSACKSTIVSLLFIPTYIISTHLFRAPVLSTCIYIHIIHMLLYNLYPPISPNIHLYPPISSLYIYFERLTSVCCSVLQCVAVCCSVLQCISSLYIYFKHPSCLPVCTSPSIHILLFQSVSSYTHPYPSISIHIHLYLSISIYIHPYRTPILSTCIYIYIIHILLSNLYPSTHIHLYPPTSIYIHPYPSISIPIEHPSCRLFFDRHVDMYCYGVATISRLLKLIGLFCRIWSVL